MFVRVVRFTGVSADRIRDIRAQIDERGGPPAGVPTTGIQVLADEAQGTAVVLQFYETADDMRVGEETFDAMDASDTPGTRASVDRCELVLERRVTA